jgi:hypothetical protein
MWTLLIRAAITGIFGSAFGKWFLSTTMGMWFQMKLNIFMGFLAARYHLNILKKEAKWKTDYPLLDEKIKNLEDWSHPPVAPGGLTEIIEQMDKLQKQVDALTPIMPTAKRKCAACTEGTKQKCTCKPPVKLTTKKRG